MRERCRSFLDMADLMQQYLYESVQWKYLKDELQVTAAAELPWFCDDPSTLIHGWLDEVMLLDRGPSNALLVRPFEPTHADTIPFVW